MVYNWIEEEKKRAQTEILDSMSELTSNIKYNTGSGSAAYEKGKMSVIRSINAKINKLK